MFRYLEICKDSLSEDGEIADAKELLRYYENNREGLLPYQPHELDLPKVPKKDGKGYEYPVVGYVIGQERKIRGDMRNCLQWRDTKIEQ